MSKIDINKFISYIDEWKELDRQYNNIKKIPFYHFYKQIVILNKKHKLTSNYNKYLNSLK